MVGRKPMLMRGVGVLHRIADLIEENLSDLALAESIDNGKPVSLSTRVDIPRAAANFRFFCQYHCRLRIQCAHQPGAFC